MTDYTTAYKTNRVLNIIILSLLLILIRVWYLTVIQRDHHLQQAYKPQRRTTIESIERATIRDRFNLPLALNKVQYNVAVCYSQLRQIPSISWTKDENGKLVKVQERMNYIANLAKILAEELDMDPQSIEDIIHGKASLFPHTPFAIKEDISEEQYFRLRLLEKDWLGLQAQRGSKRFYPQGKTGSDVIGYLGAINQKEYFNIAAEMRELQSYITLREEGEPVILPKNFRNPLEVRKRLKELQEKAYTINDLVGKTGIESSFDETLRGLFGKKTYEVDNKGNFLRELPGTKEALSGQRILLSLSSELQQFAEQLLIENEKQRGPKDPLGQPRLDRPWIKGGAIVAMIPQTGEILTLASYPRFDPNDFIPARDPELKKNKQSSVLRWLESESYISEIWDGKRPLEREFYLTKEHRYDEEKLFLTWEHYLDIILSKESALRNEIGKIKNVQTAVFLQREMQALLKVSGQDNMLALIQVLYNGDGHSPSSRGLLTSTERKEIELHLEEEKESVSIHKKNVDSFLESISHNEDKLLLIDLCRLLIDEQLFSDSLLTHIGKQDLSFFHHHCQAFNLIQSLVRTQMQQLYHDTDFKLWRQGNFKEFLRQKRKEEKERKHYARPYTEYLEALEKKCFKEFWDSHRLYFLETFILGAPRESAALAPYNEYLVELSMQMKDKDPSLELLYQTLSYLSPEERICYLKTFRSFEELDQPLLGKYRFLRNLRGQQLQKHLAAAFYPLSGFGYGRSQAFRQSTPAGSVFKLVIAYEALLERYQWLKEQGKSLDQLNPLTLIDDLKAGNKNSNSQILGYHMDGQTIQRLYKGGRLPRSSHGNIGKVDIIGALEQSSNIYFSILASEHILDPNVLFQTTRQFGFGSPTGIEIPGEIAGNVPTDLAHNRTGLYAFAIGQHSLVVTPLQTASMLSTFVNHGQIVKPKVVQVVAGMEPTRDQDTLFTAAQYSFKEALDLVGIDFPLFTETLKQDPKPYVFYKPAEIKNVINLPEEIRETIFEGMQRVISGPRGTARANTIRHLCETPKVFRDYVDLQHQVIGKTGTAQILYKQTIDAETQPEMSNHVWCAAISFLPGNEEHPNERWSEPELVVVVYLRFGDAGGKEAAPIAIQMIKKWREICEKHGKSSHLTPSFSSEN